MGGPSTGGVVSPSSRSRAPIAVVPRTARGSGLAPSSPAPCRPASIARASSRGPDPLRKPYLLRSRGASRSPCCDLSGRFARRARGEACGEAWGSEDEAVGTAAREFK